MRLKTNEYWLNLLKNYNPFINEEIKAKETTLINLKELFPLPIICLVWIYDFIVFWRDRYGKDGYFKKLEEMVIPIKQIGRFPYVLKYKFLTKWLPFF